MTTCVLQTLSCPREQDPEPVALTEEEAGRYPDLSKLPQCCWDLKEVFNKDKATSLPPHRPLDCAIELLPGALLPKGRLYSLSGPERKAMDEYFQSSLKSGIIRPSSSPVGAGFFLCRQKRRVATAVY